jgi:ClpP class serine protease
MHVDLSGALDQAGVQITYIEAPKGGLKTAGSSYRRLDKRTEQYLQAFVDASYDEFVALVAENRGLDDAAVRETEARVFRADEALALGLIDEVKTPSEAVSTFVAELADDEPSEEEDEEMTTKTPATAAAPAAAAPEVASVPDAAAITAAVNADRERCAAIKALPEASKLPKLADQLALAGYSVEEATATLKAGVADLPSEPAAAAAAPAAEPTPAAPKVDEQNHLETAMAGTKQPNVGAGESGGGAPGEAKSDSDIAASILADASAATGRTFATAK